MIEKTAVLMSIVLLVIPSATCQRTLKAPRPGANNHIEYDADKFRGTNCFVINVRGADEFWNRYQSNKPAIYTTLAQALRDEAHGVDEEVRRAPERPARDDSGEYETASSSEPRPSPWLPPRVDAATTACLDDAASHRCTARG